MMDMAVETPQRGRGRPTGQKKDVSKDPKYQAVRIMYLDGHTYEEIGDKLGVTRQRIEQMVRRLDLVSPTQRRKDFVAIVAGTCIRKGLTVAELAKMFGIPRHMAWKYCHEHDVTPPKMTAAEREEFEALSNAVQSGSSMRKAVSGQHKKAEKLRRFMVDNGIDARGRSRHDDFSQRKELLEKWVSEGKTWAQCADLLSAHDGRKISGGGVYGWAWKHMPHLISRAKLSPTTANEVAA